MRLYELTAELENLVDAEEWDENALEIIQRELAKKTDSIGALIRQIWADVDMLKAEEKRLTDKRKALENRERQIKDYVLFQLKAHDLTEFKGKLFKFSIQNNPPSAVADNEGETPAEYLTIIPQQLVADKKKIIEALKGGKHVPGWHLEKGEHLRIR